MQSTIKDKFPVLYYSSEILEIIDNVDEFDRGDLQGAIEAQLMMLIKQVENKLK